MHDPLRLAASTLRRALKQPWANRSRAWLEDLQAALSQVETALCGMPAATAGKILAPVEQPVQHVSPALVRDTQKLRQDHLELWREVNQLLQEAHDSANFPDLYERGDRLAAGLEAYLHHESQLVLENVNRDTGGED
jgi:hypothetical protein